MVIESFMWRWRKSGYIVGVFIVGSDYFIWFFDVKVDYWIGSRYKMFISILNFDVDKVEVFVICVKYILICCNF